MARDFTVKMTKDQKRAWSQAQTYLALGNALNGAKALGFDSCPMGGFYSKEYTRILKIPDYLEPVMLCPVGMPLTSLCRRSGSRKRISFSDSPFLLFKNEGKIIGESQVLMATKP